MNQENKNVSLNKTSHSRKLLSGIYDACNSVQETQTICVEDPRVLWTAISGMTTNLNSTSSSPRSVGMRGIGAGPHGCSAKKSCGLTPCVVRKGFTLIELLVVVLIIGILAAVALPQYQKAVVKTRFATLKNLVKSIEVSQEAYFLANGEYTTNFDNLIVQLPAGGELSETKDKYTFVGWYCRLAAQVTACKVTNAGITYQQFYKHTTSPHAGKTKCLAWNDLAAQICLQETGDESPINYSNSSDGPYKAYTYQ